LNQKELLAVFLGFPFPLQIFAVAGNGQALDVGFRSDSLLREKAHFLAPSAFGDAGEKLNKVLSFFATVMQTFLILKVGFSFFTLHLFSSLSLFPYLHFFLFSPSINDAF